MTSRGITFSSGDLELRGDLRRAGTAGCIAALVLHGWTGDRTGSSALVAKALKGAPHALSTSPAALAAANVDLLEWLASVSFLPARKPR